MKPKPPLNNTTQSKYLIQLPAEVLCVIFALVDTSSRLQLQLSCRQVHALISDDLVWKKAFEYKFGLLLEPVVYKHALISRLSRLSFKATNFSYGGDSVDKVEFTDNGIICGLIGNAEVQAFNYQGQPLGARKVFDQATCSDFRHSLLVGAGNCVNYGKSMKSNWKQIDLKDPVSNVIGLPGAFFLALTITRCLIVNVAKGCIYSELMVARPVLSIKMEGEHVIGFTAEMVLVFKLPELNKTVDSVASIYPWKFFKLECNNAWLSSDSEYLLALNAAGLSIGDQLGKTNQELKGGLLTKVSLSKKVIITVDAINPTKLYFYRWDNGAAIISKTYQAGHNIQQIAYTPLLTILALSNGKIHMLDNATLTTLKTFSVRGSGPLKFWYNNDIVVVRENRLYVFALLSKQQLRKPASSRPKVVSPRHDTKLTFQEEVDRVKREVSMEREKRLEAIRKVRGINGSLGLTDDELVEYAMILSAEQRVGDLTDDEALAFALQASLNS